MKSQICTVGEPVGDDTKAFVGDGFHSLPIPKIDEKLYFDFSRTIHFKMSRNNLRQSYGQYQLYWQKLCWSKKYLIPDRLGFPYYRGPCVRKLFTGLIMYYTLKIKNIVLYCIVISGPTYRLYDRFMYGR